MPIVTKFHLPKESFLFACGICEQGNPSAIHDVIEDFGVVGQKLVELNAFIISTKDWVEDNRRNYKMVKYQNNRPGYFDKDNNFIAVSYEAIRNYQLNLQWLINIIADNLEIAKQYPPASIVDDFLWRIGDIKLKTEVPVFFARRLFHYDIFAKIYHALERIEGINQGIILTTSASNPVGCNLPGKHKVIYIKHCLVHNNSNFHIDKNIIKAALGQEIKREGFSNGYRSAFFNNIEYNFTKKQAAIIEALDKNGGSMNKDELLAEANSDQYDLFRIFRNNQGKQHPAWNVIIKSDGKGNYWLDC